MCRELNGSCVRFLCRFRRTLNGFSGSVRVNHVPALNGGTAICGGPWRLDDCPALCSGCLVESRQRRRSARGGHKANGQKAAVRPHPRLHSPRSARGTFRGTRCPDRSFVSRRPIRSRMRCLAWCARSQRWYQKVDRRLYMLQCLAIWTVFPTVDSRDVDQVRLREK